MDEYFNVPWENSMDIIEDGEVLYDADGTEILPEQTEEVIYDTSSHIGEFPELELSSGRGEDIQDGKSYFSNENTSSEQLSSQDNFSLLSVESQVTEEVVIDHWNGNITEEVVSYEQSPTEDVQVPIPLQQDEYISLRPYPCDFCNKRFRNKTSLINHMAAHQKTHNYHECSKCRVRFISKNDLMDHKKLHEHAPADDSKFSIVFENRQSFVCKHCGVGFTKEKSLNSHLRIHDGNYQVPCPKCKESFRDSKSLVEHVHMFHPNVDFKKKNRYGTYSCKTCGVSFCRQDDLKRHQQNHMEDESDNNSESGFTCNVCGEFFAEPLDLLAHAEEHARGFEYKCMICSENFIDEETCALHVQEQHPGEEGLSCSQCPRVFYDENRLKKHMLSHSTQKMRSHVREEEFPEDRTNRRRSVGKSTDQQYSCHECGKSFATRSSQQIHMRIHTGERPYGCSFCHKAFTDGGTLRKHERIHTGEKPYACVVCPKAFNQRVVLREHIRSHHAGPDPKFLESTTPFSCPVCSDMFSESHDLIVHLIHHCDMNTAMKRQPRVGPRKYVRRRKLKPHEIALMSQDEPAQEEYDIQEETEEEPQYPQNGETPKYEIDMDTNWMRKTMNISQNHNFELDDAYVDQEMSPSTSVTQSPTPNEDEIKDNTSVSTSRAKMIHTEKKPKSVDPPEIKGRRFKKKFTTKRLYPEYVENVRPRTKNVTYSDLKNDRPSLATFSEEDFEVNSPRRGRKRNLPKEYYSDQIETSEVGTEQNVEYDETVSTDELRENRKKAAKKSYKNTKRSKSRHTVNTDIESEKIEEAHGLGQDEANEFEQCEEQIVYETPEYYAIPESTSLPKECPEKIFEDNSEYKDAPEYINPESLKPEEQKPNNNQVSTLKQEIIDPLLELAEISMQHAKSLFQCEMCNAVFLERSQLVNHVNVHI